MTMARRITKSKFGEKTEVLIGQDWGNGPLMIIPPFLPDKMSGANTERSEIEYNALKP